MKLTKTTLLPLLVVPALLAFSDRGTEIQFGPDEGSTLTKSFATSNEISLDEMSMVMNGQEMDPEMMGMEQTISNSLKVVITDEYVGVAGDRPSKLKRTFDELSSEMSMSMTQAMMGEMPDVDLSGESELEGLSVVFSWDEDDGFAVEFADGADEDEELLEGLIEDTDLRAFLPDGEVDEGATWEIPAEAMRAVLAFGGNLHVELDTEDMGDMGGMGIGGGGGMPSPDAFLGDIEGTIIAEYVGSGDEGGTRVATIRLTIEVSSAKDMTEFFQEMMADMPEEMADMEMEYEAADIEFEFEGEATLLWDLAGGHVHSFELNGEVISTIDMAMNMAMGGMGDMEMEISMTLSGNQTVTLTTSAGGE